MKTSALYEWIVVINVFVDGRSIQGQLTLPVSISCSTMGRTQSPNKVVLVSSFISHILPITHKGPKNILCTDTANTQFTGHHGRQSAQIDKSRTQFGQLFQTLKDVVSSKCQTDGCRFIS